MSHPNSQLWCVRGAGRDERARSFPVVNTLWGIAKGGVPAKGTFGRDRGPAYQSIGRPGSPPGCGTCCRTAP